MRVQPSSAKSAEAVEKKKGPAKPESKDQKKTVSTQDSDSKVSLKGKQKKSETLSDHEIREGELLLEHVNSGKLSEKEAELAMNRVEQILKKYQKQSGTA